MKSKTSTYYISVETKSKHFPVFKYEYVKKEKKCTKIRSQVLSHMYALLNRCFDKWLQRSSVFMEHFQGTLSGKTNFQAYFY